MKEIKINNATVRIHGTVNREELEVATKRYAKKVNRWKQKQN